MCRDLASPLIRVHNKVLRQYYMKSDNANISGTGFIFKYTRMGYHSVPFSAVVLCTITMSNKLLTSLYVQKNDMKYFFFSSGHLCHTSDVNTASFVSVFVTPQYYSLQTLHLPPGQTT